jgi:hypothetical protein
MLKQKNINWGKIVKSATCSETCLNHGASIPAVPTMYSPDGSQIYLHSLDIAMKVDDSNTLRNAFGQIHESLLMEIENFDWSVHKIADYENDYMAVWNLLENLDALPDDYQFPEYHLRKLWGKFKLCRTAKSVK